MDFVKKLKIKPYINSLRFRTLFLSASGIVLGGFMAISQDVFDTKIFLFSLLTAISLQILSNLANELGDFQKGTDNQQRTGPVRSIQQGELTINQLKRIILFFVLISIALGGFLVFFSFDSFFEPAAILLLSVGALSITAAIFYTVGKRAYGYHGFGDIFVFLFFGIVSVCGSYFLLTKTFDSLILLPAFSIGFLSTSVLNLNNIRDFENDKRCHKNTVCVRLGEKNGKIYHFLLLIFAILSMVSYSILNNDNYLNYMYLLTTPLFAFHLIKVQKQSGKDLDKQFPILVMGTFIFAVLAGIGMVFFRS